MNFFNTETTMHDYISRVAEKSGIDPNAIAAIISAVMQLISSCGQKPTPKQVMEQGNFRNRVVLFHAMRKEGVRPRSDEGRKLADAMLTEATNEGEVTEFLAMCQ